MEDSITIEITVKANKEKVYGAIADPTQITSWFPTAIDTGTLAVGERTVLMFEDEGTKHLSQIYVVDAKQYEYFAYKWVPGGNGNIEDDILAVPTTLVEFFIEETTDGSKITVKESGFSKLPTEIAEQSLKQNTGGWKYMIERLETVMNQ